MNELQQLHAASIARHFAEYAEPFVHHMNALGRAKPPDLESWTPERFLNEMNTYVESLLRDLESVIDDMYPGLSPVKAEILDPLEKAIIDYFEQHKEQHD